VKDKRSSYIGELSSGYESDTVVKYDPAVEEAQIGKERTEEVTTENIWENDKHLPMGLGELSFKEAAIKLRRVARQLATMEIDYKSQQGVKTANSEESLRIAYMNDLDKIADKIKSIGNDLDSLARKAQINHPSEPVDEYWLEESSPQLGDEEWIEIGPGTFDDPRDEIGKPLPQA